MFFYFKKNIVYILFGSMYKKILIFIHLTVISLERQGSEKEHTSVLRFQVLMPWNMFVLVKISDNPLLHQSH